MLRTRSVLFPALVFLLVFVAALVSARPAAAAPCWQRVLSDWRDGHIDGTYSASCLRAAIVNMPEDLKIYGSAQQDITRLLNELQARQLASRQTASSTPPATTTTAAPSKVEPAGSRSLAGRKPQPKQEPAQRVASSPKPDAAAGGGGGGFPYRTLLLIVSAVSAVSVLGVASARGLRG